MALALLLFWLKAVTLPQPHWIPYARKPMSKWLAREPLKAPNIKPWMLPYQGWAAEYKQYFAWHAHSRSERFPVDKSGHRRPTMIVMHFTVSHDAQSVWDGFARGCNMDNGDYGFPFGHPSVHFMVDSDGAIYQLLPTDWRCTGAYGVNHVALSIEMVAMNEEQLLSRPRQLYASFCLVDRLRREFDIPLDRIIGHFQVSCGKWMVSDYLDDADSKWPYGYPPAAFRFDPGVTYMGWLHRRLQP